MATAMDDAGLWAAQPHMLPRPETERDVCEPEHLHVDVPGHAVCSCANIGIGHLLHSPAFC